jgi:hypothetical protein
MRSRGTRSALPRRRSSSSGKPLKDHLDHYEAIRYVRALARLGTPLTEADLRQLYLLMILILILIRGGYPPVAVRPEDRPAYVGALQEAQSRPRVRPLRSSSLRALGHDFGRVFERGERGPPRPARAEKIAGRCAGSSRCRCCRIAQPR